MGISASDTCRPVETPPPPGASKLTSAPPRQISFYQVYGRPVVKMLLVAFFTYQVVYSIWMKLEGNEMTALREGAHERLHSESIPCDTCLRSPLPLYGPTARVTPSTRIEDLNG